MTTDTHAAALARHKARIAAGVIPAQGKLKDFRPREDRKQKSLYQHEDNDAVQHHSR